MMLTYDLFIWACTGSHRPGKLLCRIPGASHTLYYPSGHVHWHWEFHHHSSAISLECHMLALRQDVRKLDYYFFRICIPRACNYRQRGRHAHGVLCMTTVVISSLARLSCVCEFGA